MGALQTEEVVREPEAPVEALFVNRWSPRAMSGETISTQELMTLFEAARWAPSSYNNQPWRFVYGLRGTPAWERLWPLLNDHNRSWAHQGAALIVVLSKKTFADGKPSKTHSYDTGAAWMSLALQGSLRGLVVHGMEGFDDAQAAETVGAGEDFGVEAMAVIGRPGDKKTLRPALQAREFPSNRKPLAEIAFEGRVTTPS